MPRTCLVTGATGFVGSHAAEALVARGDAVRTIARPNSDTALLDKLGVTIIRGDLTDAARSEFDRWLRRSPQHLSAYLEIAAIWNEGPSLDPARKWDSAALVAAGREGASPPQAGASSAVAGLT